MIGKEALNIPEKRFLFLGFGVLLFSFFYHLGIYPLFLEEPRRGLIALEMIIQDNYWVPTQTGDLYFRKPPVYNWLLILSYKIFGEYSEFATRFFSVLSHLLLALVTFRFSKKHLGVSGGIIAAASYLVAADILLSYSLLGEIDLFYALVTSASIFLIYQLGEERKYWLLFIAVYVLTAVGFLTKGLTSLSYTAISLLVYFIYKRDFKRLLSLQHISGILVFFLLSAGYFYKYSTYEDPSGWLNTLFAESADKATGGGVMEFFKHLLTFPIDTIKNALPASLLIPLLFQKRILKAFKSNDFVWFCLLIFCANFILYWVSIEAKSRYIYPLLPFIIIPLIYVAQSSEKELWIKFLKGLMIVFLALATLLTPGFLFIESLKILDNLLVTVILIELLLLGCWYALLKEKIRPYLVLLGLMVVLKFVVSNIVPETRQKNTGAAEDKALAYEIAGLTKTKPIHRYKDLRMSLTIVFYLEGEKQDILRSTEETSTGYFFCYEEDLLDFDKPEIIKEFFYQNRIPMYLIKVE